MAKTKFYTVWKGRNTGVFKTWKECEQQVKGYPGALYASFMDFDEANRAFNENPWDYISHPEKRQKRPALPINADPPDGNSLAVDAACSGNPGVMEYRGVYTETATEIFRQGPFQLGTNNIGEFLAIVHALAWMKKNKLDLPVYSDSANAIAWVRDKCARTKMERNQKNKDVFDLIERAEKWLKENTFSNPLLKWKTKEWGEIPADFGRK
jgi:ribonuclease HI